MARVALTLSILLGATTAYADFVAVNPRPTGNDLTGVFGLGNDVFVVGANGTALVTHDTGATWKPLAIGTPIGLHAIWGVGKDRSTDGGKTWKTLPLVTEHDLAAVWTDGQTIVVSSAPGELWVGK